MKECIHFHLRIITPLIFIQMLLWKNLFIETITIKKISTININVWKYVFANSIFPKIHGKQFNDILLFIRIRYTKNESNFSHLAWSIGWRLRWSSSLWYTWWTFSILKKRAINLWNCTIQKYEIFNIHWTFMLESVFILLKINEYST